MFEKEKITNNSLIKNALLNICYNILNVIFPLISTSYASHILLASGIGRVSYAQNITQYFSLLAPLGLLNYGTKRIAEASDPRQRSEIFSELFLINAVSTTVCVFSYYVLILSHPYFAKNRLLLLITGLVIIFNYINIEWYFRGKEDFSYIALRGFLIKILSLLLMIFFVREREDYWKYAFIYAFAIGGNNFFNVVKAFKDGVYFCYKDCNVLYHLKPVCLLFFNTIAGEIYTLLDTTMLGYMCGDEIVAYYSNAIKLVKVWVSVVTALCGVLLPRLSYYHNNKMEEECNQVVNKVMKVLIYIILPSIIGLLVLSRPIIIMLYGEDFIPAASTLRIASFSILAMGFSYLFGTQVLITFNQEKSLLISSIMGTITNFCLNMALIPVYSEKGAIIASVICEYMVMFFTMIYSRKFIKIRIYEKDWIFACGLSLIMGWIVFLITEQFSRDYMKVLLGIFTGALFYGSINYFFNPFIKSEVRRFRHS